MTAVQAFPASYAQSRLWFLQQLKPDLTTYHMPLLWRLRGVLDVRALEQALAALIERHATLRTSFRLQGSDLSELFNTDRTGLPPALPPLRVHYQDYAARQWQRLSGERLRKLNDCWIPQREGLESLELQALTQVPKVSGRCPEKPMAPPFRLGPLVDGSDGIPIHRLPLGDYPHSSTQSCCFSCGACARPVPSLDPSQGAGALHSR